MAQLVSPLLVQAQQALAQVLALEWVLAQVLVQALVLVQAQLALAQELVQVQELVLALEFQVKFLQVADYQTHRLLVTKARFPTQSWMHQDLSLPQLLDHRIYILLFKADYKLCYSLRRQETKGSTGTAASNHNAIRSCHQDSSTKMYLSKHSRTINDTLYLSSNQVNHRNQIGCDMCFLHRPKLAFGHHH